MLTNVRSRASAQMFAAIGAVLASGVALAQPSTPNTPAYQTPPVSGSIPGAIVHEVYLGRWVTELPNGARMVRLMWLRKTTHTLENGEVETHIAPVSRRSIGTTVPSRIGGGSVIVATHASGGGGGGGVSFGGGSSGGGGGGGGGGGSAAAGNAGSNNQPGAQGSISTEQGARPGATSPESNRPSSAGSASAGQGNASNGVILFGQSKSSGQNNQSNSQGTPLQPRPKTPPAPQSGPTRQGSGTTGSSSGAATSPPPLADTVPVSIHVDGRDGALVVVPEDLFNGQWTTNLTQTEIGGGGTRLRGRGLYPKESLARFDLAGYLEALDGAVRRHVPQDATGFATLDFEDGLLPWAERTREIYKEGMTDEAYERIAHEFFVESLRTAKAARPNVKWSYYGYPHWWESAALSERISDIYAESDAITPSHYIWNSGDPEKIKAHSGRMGRTVAAVQDLHPLGEDLPVALYLTHRYSSVDKNNKAYHPVAIEDFSVATSAAKPWADQFVMWMAASTPAEATLLSEALAEGGRIRELVYTSRRAK